jgi:hypothetical protein
MHRKELDKGKNATAPRIYSQTTQLLQLSIYKRFEAHYSKKIA